MVSLTWGQNGQGHAEVLLLRAWCTYGKEVKGLAEGSGTWQQLDMEGLGGHHHGRGDFPRQRAVVEALIMLSLKLSLAAAYVHLGAGNRGENQRACSETRRGRGCSEKCWEGQEGIWL